MTPVFVVTIEDILGLLVLSIILIMWLWHYIPLKIKQMRCKHDAGYSETRACDAICRACGKNLGFIGNLRK